MQAIEKFTVYSYAGNPELLVRYEVGVRVHVH